MSIWGDSLVWEVRFSFSYVFTIFVKGADYHHTLNVPM
jgi:hypothetical protein